MVHHLDLACAVLEDRDDRVDRRAFLPCKSAGCAGGVPWGPDGVGARWASGGRIHNDGGVEAADVAGEAGNRDCGGAARGHGEEEEAAPGVDDEHVEWHVGADVDSAHEEDYGHDYDSWGSPRVEEASSSSAADSAAEDVGVDADDGAHWEKLAH